MTDTQNADVDQSTESCDCGAIAPDGSTDGGTDQHEATAFELLAGDQTLETPLPDPVQRAFGGLLGQDSVETLGETIGALRQQVDGGTIDVADLCHADEETPHQGQLAGETHHFICFYDAVVLSALVDEPVDIRTESPDGAVLNGRAVGTAELSVTPEDAVFSFGVAPDAGNSDGELTPADLYGAVCPYVKPFPDPASYRKWAASIDVPTVAVPLSGATELAAALVD